MTTTEAEGLRIRAWRHAHGLTQKEMGKHLGVVWLTVQRWETGKRQVPSFLHLALDRLDEILPPVTDDGPVRPLVPVANAPALPDAAADPW